jgi:hypothetical protein
MSYRKSQSNHRFSGRGLRPSLLALALLALPGAAFAGATVSNGVLIVDAAGAASTVKIESFSSQLVTLYGVPGVADGTRFTATSVQVFGGSGLDKFDFDLRNSSINITVDTGDGDSETKVQWYSANGNVGNTRFDITTGNGFNKIDYDYESLNGRTTMDFNVNGNGRNEIKTNLQIKQAVSPDSWAAVGVRLNLAPGDNKVETLIDSELRDLNLTLDYRNAREAVTSLGADTLAQRLNVNYSNLGNSDSNNEKLELSTWAAATNVRIASNGGDGNDIAEYTVAQFAPGRMDINYRGDQGSGDDLSKFIALSEQGSIYINGVVSGRDGNDFALVDTGALSTFATFTLDGHAGDDNMSFVVSKGSLASTAAVTPVLRGGDGNDFLTLLLPGAYSGVGAVPGSYPQLNGGNGTDLCDGFGQFLACETIK